MASAVNFENLRAITDGDPELEGMLFRTFLASSTDFIREMKEAFAGGNEEAWRDRAHALKGICLNVGALPLGELCSKAQADYRAPLEEKQRLLAAIEKEFTIVCGVIEGQL